MLNMPSMHSMQNKEISYVSCMCIHNMQIICKLCISDNMLNIMTQKNMQKNMLAICKETLNIHNKQINR